MCFTNKWESTYSIHRCSALAQSIHRGGAAYLYLISILIWPHFDTYPYTGCPKKNVVSWKKGHNYLQNHPKCKSWGCFGKMDEYEYE